MTNSGSGDLRVSLCCEALATGDAGRGADAPAPDFLALATSRWRLAFLRLCSVEGSLPALQLGQTAEALGRILSQKRLFQHLVQPLP